MAWRLFPRASPRACAIYITDSTTKGEKGDRLMPLEILDGALVLLSCLQALEGSQVPPLPRFGILLMGIKTVTGGGQLPDHPVTRSSVTRSSCNADGDERRCLLASVARVDLDEELAGRQIGERHVDVRESGCAGRGRRERDHLTARAVEQTRGEGGIAARVLRRRANQQMIGPAEFPIGHRNRGRVGRQRLPLALRP